MLELPWGNSRSGELWRPPWHGGVWFVMAFLALPSLETGALGSRQIRSFDKEFQLSALWMPYVLNEGERTIVPRRWDTGDTHQQSLHI